MELQGKRAVVVGLGESGLAMSRWLHRQGAQVRVADSRGAPPNLDALREAAPDTELVAGPFAAATFADADLVALSPGVARTTPALAGLSVPVVSEIELFATGVRALMPTAKILAITGSNGKTTTTALTAHLLGGVGLPAVACGNISPSALDALMTALDGGVWPAVWVLELSSFQLETTHHLNAVAATILNVSEDHLDRYEGSIARYAAAKARVFQGQGMMILNRDDDWSITHGRCDRRFVTFGLNPPPCPADYGLVGGAIWRGGAALVDLAEIKLSGLHNAANAMAALALCEAAGADPQRLVEPLKSFRGLPHRVETVLEQGGILYVDDSKGTNVGATLAAIEGMGRPVAVILGGDGKGQDFTPLQAALKRHGRAVALIGRDAPMIAAAIADCGLPQKNCAGMTEAVRWLASAARPGDCVLLSPACASLDMYRNYAHRAAAFIAAVRELSC
ncbi:MAG: UDP-N-acetylmuramoyl-L-alanine--D-glutamate ligase [Azonexus sp.]|jgi:UDP-N-acetylmuramoylalanine--D-glutamate ligase|nr:UDP-N-acetylmuramoyl-L-alanine--D-glutamate ligase [Azonexus sp.]